MSAAAAERKFVKDVSHEHSTAGACRRHICFLWQVAEADRYTGQEPASDLDMLQKVTFGRGAELPACA